MMTFEDFTERVLASGATVYLLDKSKTSHSHPFTWLAGGNSIDGASSVPGDEWYIVKEWCSGGVSGGSCWGGERYAVPGDAEPEFDALDKILCEVCPMISFLQYKKLVASLHIAEYDYCTSDYYGNSDDYQVRSINIKELYDALCKVEK